MPVMVALLRGINVGGRTKLPMADLRAVVGACGFEDPATYIQSGNVVFGTAERSAEKVARRLRDALAEATELAPEVMVRTRAQMRRVVADNPFADRTDDPTKLHVAFVGGTAAAQLPDLDLAAFAPEELAAVGRQLYLYLPDGMGRSPLAEKLVAGRRTVPVTVRNWRTVTTLVAMADDR